LRSYLGFLRHVLRTAAKPRPEVIAADQAAQRVLLRAVKASRDDPAEPRSAMDGYAVRARDLREASSRRPVWLHVTGLSPAGRTPERRLGCGETHRIMTGAPLPRAADSVVPLEEVHSEGDSVCFTAPVLRGHHVRRPGENFRRGRVLIPAGTPLRPQEIGLAITAGAHRLTVARRPRVGVLSTGDELVPPGSRLGRGEVFDSNRPTILAQVEETGAIPVDLGHVGDRPAALRSKVRRVRGRIDLLVTIGGVSAGDLDVVKILIRDYPAVELVRVAMKPGKPQAFGRLGRLVWHGLPGNPVSAMVSFDRFVRPFLLRSMGHRFLFRTLRTGTCTTPLSKKHRRREFVRAWAVRSDCGWRVRRAAPDGSSNLRGMVNANAFIILPERCERVNAGDPVAFELFSDPATRTTP
jgi:molybdopterin molybdotransferase